MLALVEKIRLTEQYINGQQDRINQRMAGLRGNQLGPWLTQMVQQKLAEARSKEAMLKTRFEEARDEAINLSGQMAQIELLEHDVKRLGDMNDVLLNQIASLDLKQNGQEVRVAVIEEPAVSTTPVFPKLRDVALLSVFCGFLTALGLVTLLDALDDRFRSPEEMQGRLGLPMLTMVQRLEGLAAEWTASAGDACQAHLGGQRELPHVANGLDADASRCPANRGYQRRAGRRQDDGPGEPGRVLRPGRQADVVDRRRLAAARSDGIDGHAGPFGPERSAAFGGRRRSSGATHITSSGVTGLDILPSGPRPSDPAELLGSPRFSQLLAWAETRLRRDPHRQPSHAGHHRHGDHRPVGGRRDPGGAAGQKPPPPGDARRANGSTS